MKQLMLRIIAFSALSASAPLSQLLAQDITGAWQGTLMAQPGKDLRTVIKISKADDGALKAVLYSIDQNGQGMAGAVTLQGTAVKISIPGVGATYEGKLNTDGTSMTGAMDLAGRAAALNLQHVTSETAWAIPDPPARPKPMAADANPAFEVATVKPSNPDQPGRGVRINGRRFTTLNTTLSYLITFAYGVHPRQITGGPAWMETEKYDVAAQPDGEGQPNEKQWKTMLQKLLADRFQLAFHRDKKELPVYAIVVGKTGPKLTKSEGNPNGLPSLFFRGFGVLPARNATMADFAGVMQGAVLDRPVLDETGLPGRYDFMLSWTPDEFQFGGLGIKLPAPSDTAPNPDLFTAMQQQLGLKLESTKAQVEVFVVDHVEKPSAN